MQETWGQAFKRRPLEMILLFTIGLPLVPFFLIFGYGFIGFKSSSDKKKYSQILESLSKIESEFRSSHRSKKEYLQRCFDQISTRLTSNGSFGPTARGLLRETMIKQTWSDLEQLGCDPEIKYTTILSADKNAKEMVEESVDRIFLDAKNEIDAQLKQISLAENIPQLHNNDHGAFYNAYQDLIGVFEGSYSSFSDPVKIAYGYARVELSAMLLLQGIHSDADFNEEKELFPNAEIEAEDKSMWENLDASAAFDALCDPDDSEIEKTEAHDLADAFISQYDSISGVNDGYYFSDFQFALSLVYSGKITSTMVGPISRSEQDVRQLVSRLWELDRDKDNISIESLCGSRNIYEYLLESDEDEHFTEVPQDDDEIPF
jgi:hypothetical protein